MGRVAKYKRVKSFDLFSKQSRRAGVRTDGSEEFVWGTTRSDGRRVKKRSRVAAALKQKKLKRRGERRDEADDEGFDLAPAGGDDFDLADLKGSVKRQKLDDDLADPNQRRKVSVSAFKGCNVARPSVPQTDQEEKEMRRVVLGSVSKRGGKGGRGGGSDASEVAVRKKGESVKEFLRREDERTRLIMKRGGAGVGSGASAPNPERAERKRAFLKDKKLKRKKGRGQMLSREAEDDVSEDRDGDGLITGERAAAAAASILIDPAERPPDFQALPRGAQKKRVVIPSALWDRTDKGGKGVGSVGKVSGKGRMDEAKIVVEQRAMEAMRRKVQEQYQVVREKRRKAGEGFHL